jgi:cellulose biosynthesis protein BcsQ
VNAGKTTLAVNLAVAAELLDMPTVLVDLDPPVEREDLA